MSRRLSAGASMLSNRGQSPGLSFCRQATSLTACLGADKAESAVSFRMSRPGRWPDGIARLYDLSCARILAKKLCHLRRGSIAGLES